MRCVCLGLFPLFGFYTPVALCRSSFMRHARFIYLCYWIVVKMAEDDIYKSKSRYERFMADLDVWALEPSQRKRCGGKPIRYFCRHAPNLQYFRKMDTAFRIRDSSYVRRLRLFDSLLLLCSVVNKDLAVCTREDIDEVIAFMHTAYKSNESKETCIKDIKQVWKTLFPELDERGRPDDTIVPYPVRHLFARFDKSRQKMRKDKLTWQEYEQLLDYFNKDVRMQAYITIAIESLARPQELLYIKLGSVELFDNYAKIYIAEHGKEGVGLLQCIDSYPYLIKWLEQHPQRNNKDAFLFLNTGNTNTLKQLTPFNVGKMLRKACKDLNIQKPVTCYSLKRNGVTMRRLRGDSDMEIQHAARWKSLKQLQTYDLSSQDEAFKKELEKRGLLPQDQKSAGSTTAKKCGFCNAQAGFNDILCPNCKRPLDRHVIVEEVKAKEQEVQKLQQKIESLSQQYDSMKQQMVQDLMQQLLTKTQTP